MNRAATVVWCLTFLVGADSFAAERGEVTLLVGEVMEISANGGEKSLKTGDKVAEGATIRTGEASRVVILASRGSAIRITANSEVTFAKMRDESRDSAVRVNLRRGSVAALIDRSKTGPIDFNIHTPHGVAQARGTFFAVAIADGKTYTRVRHGKVSVTAQK